MKKNNNKKTFWFLGIFIFSALAIIAVLSFLAFYDKTNPGSNFLTVNSISNTGTNETSENAEENNDYFLLKNDKNGETIVAIGGYNQYLDNANITSVGAGEIISYGENNEQLIYTFFDKEQYENCQKQNNTNECPQIRKFVSYNTETGERTTILEKDYAKVKKHKRTNSPYEFASMKIVDDYLYVLETPSEDMGWGFVAPDEIIFRVNLKNPQGYEYLNNEEVIGWMKIYENKIYFIYSAGDEGGDAIRNINLYNPENNSLKTLWEEEDYGISIIGEGFFYNSEYIITPYDENEKMLVYGINLETGKRRLISESKEKFTESDYIIYSSFDGYSKIIFKRMYPSTSLNKMYFYDLEKDTWDSMGNPEIRLATDQHEDIIKFNLEELKSNGLNYTDQNINQLYSLYYYAPSKNYDSNDDWFENLYERTN